MIFNKIRPWDPASGELFTYDSSIAMPKPTEGPMSYQNIDALIKKQVGSFSPIEPTARLSAQNLIHALEGRVFPQGVPNTTPRTLFVLDSQGDSWNEVPSTQHLMSLQGRVLIFAIGVRFFQQAQEVAKVILPVMLTTHGGDADFNLGAAFQATSASNGGDYSQVASHAVSLIGQAAASW